MQTACPTEDGRLVRVRGGSGSTPPAERPFPSAPLSSPDDSLRACTFPIAFQPNETWVNSHVDNCTQYRCEVKNGLHVLTPRPTPCPDVSSCQVCPAARAAPRQRPHPHPTLPRFPTGTPTASEAPPSPDSPAPPPPPWSPHCPERSRPAPSPPSVSPYPFRASSGKPAAATPVRKWVSRGPPTHPPPPPSLYPLIPAPSCPWPQDPHPERRAREGGGRGAAPGRGPQRSPPAPPPPFLRLPRQVPSPRQQDRPDTPGLCHPGPGQRHVLRGLMPRSVQVSQPVPLPKRPLPAPHRPGLALGASKWAQRAGGRAQGWLKTQGRFRREEEGSARAKTSGGLAGEVRVQ